jgi:hypothetical protein
MEKHFASAWTSQNSWKNKSTKPASGWGTIMQQTPYPKIVAFVEGDMEQMFLNNNFNYVKVVSVSNGISWSTNALADQIASFYKADEYYSWWMIVWVDRERRPENSDEIEQHIREKLCDAGADPERIKILVADRMIENVILADEKFIRLHFGDIDYSYQSSGLGGKRILSEKYGQLGIHYRETKHEVAALKMIRLFRAAQSCAAVSRFVNVNPLPCWWIDQDNDPAAA